ncbi:uncharacterized protein G6M90_00g005880 [Metarhizium brunneum]|uniref:Uncharacterized protein n=1 Tax=Metarhizium brunneum TaxID=500148 RepID=A0A7D5UR81_9HYPO|nr:hypothetical protein G6M90_00g005880 [Metarhizium brunneum]
MTSIPSVAANPSCAKKDYALLQSWKAAIEIVMLVLTAAPFGMAADAYGRKRILQLSVAGITSAQAFDIVIGRFPETFPVHLMVWKGFWVMMGGGGTVFSAMIFTIFSDISTEAQSNVPLMLAQQFSGRPDALDLAVQIYLSIMWSNILKVVVLTIILPLASYLLAKKLGLNPVMKDVYISAVSIVALVVGSLGIVVGKATGSALVVASIYIYALGCGYGPAMHSLLGLLSGGCHIGMLYAIIRAMQSVGNFMGGLLFGASFEMAPFLFTALFLVLGAGALFLIQLEDTQQRQPIWINLDDLVVHNVSP